MARIKHVALSTDDPVKTAEFYKEVFGLTELRREPTDTGAHGVWLSDGYIYFAILKYGGGENPPPRGGPPPLKRNPHQPLFLGAPPRAAAPPADRPPADGPRGPQHTLQA